MITFDAFSKVELRVVTIISAERVEGSDKLIKLVVDMGIEKPAIDSPDQHPLPIRRQIIAGIGKRYEPEQLAGKQIVIVANLEPRTLMGLTSEGMVLAASDGSPVLLTPDRSVPSGSVIG